MSSSTNRKNIFVFGLDDFHRADLEALPRADEFQFHSLLTLEEATRADLHPVDETLEQAQQILEEFDGPVDAIISHWDFPSSVMVPILRQRFGHPGPTVESVLRCEHKYWSRREQQQVASEVVPSFAAVNPFADDPLENVDFDYPFWLKPVKAHSSNLGFRIDRRQDLDEALPQIRDRIALFGEPLNYLTGFAQLPEEIRQVDGYHCIAEAIISEGHQCTLEGYRYQGDFQIYGAIDTIRDAKIKSCLSRYEYPSRLPREVLERMKETSTRILDHMGYDDAPFNVEYFWHEDTDDIYLLEINSRISQSHCPLFALVDGESHQQVVIDLALGKRPRRPEQQGGHKVAAKFMMRVFEDGVVAHAPSAGDETLLNERFPEARFHSHVSDGQNLSALPFQDSYSFNIADIYMGAGDDEELLEKYNTAKQMMPFEILRRPEIR